eukprot:gb/GFBE01018659.1/.p1 GENE.gb/GFBE01018659.1/~~gb/GFBE01018659.1/.p1  ORF type:complete len:623 (+),score=91.25 gb/GFBE01018659.1/:1-1869(+)
MSRDVASLDLRLYSGHLLDSGEDGRLVPISSSRIDQELDNVAMPVGQRSVNPSSCWPASIDGRKIVVRKPSGGSVALELDISVSQVTGRRPGTGDGAACISVAKARHCNGRWRGWESCWLFTIHDGTLTFLVGELLARGAMLGESMSLPRKLIHLSIGNRSNVYLARSRDVVPYGDNSDSDDEAVDSSSSPVTASNSPESLVSSERSDSKDSSKENSPEEVVSRSPTLHKDESIAPPSGAFLPEGSEEEHGMILKFYNAPAFADTTSSGNLVADLCGDDIPGMTNEDSEDAIWCGVELEHLATEVSMLSAAQGHKNIVKLYGVAQMPSPLTMNLSAVIMTEHCNGGSLRTRCRSMGRLEECRAADLMVGLFDALKFLHGKDILHRNINPDNVVLRQGTNDWVLCAFGSACREHEAKSQPDVGTPGCLAPEVIERNMWTRAADVFAAGTVLYFAGMRKFPFGGCKRAEGTKKRTLLGQFDFQEKDGDVVVSDRFQAVVRQLLASDHARRPTVLEARNDPWFESCGYAVIKIPLAKAKNAGSQEEALSWSGRLRKAMPAAPWKRSQSSAAASRLRYVDEEMLGVGPSIGPSAGEQTIRPRKWRLSSVVRGWTKTCARTPPSAEA